mmetsp:Transcript_13252/g.42018  ORF Transcript_13252/g.42018 Transcript_13252/m.42018 type:complete len:336 (-) Transcript_13252:27-1034(-)
MWRKVDLTLSGRTRKSQTVPNAARTCSSNAGSTRAIAAPKAAPCASCAMPRLRCNAGRSGIAASESKGSSACEKVVRNASGGGDRAGEGGGCSSSARAETQREKTSSRQPSAFGSRGSSAASASAASRRCDDSSIPSHTASHAKQKAGSGSARPSAEAADESAASDRAVVVVTDFFARSNATHAVENEKKCVCRCRYLRGLEDGRRGEERPAGHASERGERELRVPFPFPLARPLQHRLRNQRQRPLQQRCVRRGEHEQRMHRAGDGDRASPVGARAAHRLLEQRGEHPRLLSEQPAAEQSSRGVQQVPVEQLHQRAAQIAPRIEQGRHPPREAQ